MFSDRIYGNLVLPAIVTDLANRCPLVLRLREIRMPNTPFHSYPSFAGVSRFEHSLGVAHLAYRWAQHQGLQQHEAEALSVAAIYHDSATAAFSHLYEEFLITAGFDHEAALVDLLTGQTHLGGAEFAQVFMGRSCLLRELVPYDATDRISLRLVIDILQGSHLLSPIISGQIDLDNIDNVVRAVTAMGLIKMSEISHPYAMADALTLSDDGVVVDGASAYAVADWSRLRRMLYGAILTSEVEFRTQAAVKWAIKSRSRDDPSILKAEAWVHTEPTLVFDNLRRSDFSRYLIDQVRMASPPALQFCAWTSDIGPVLGSDGAIRLGSAGHRLSDLTQSSVFLNYYIDKRERPVQFAHGAQRSIFDQSAFTGSSTMSDEGRTPGLVGGVYLKDGAFRSGRDIKARRYEPAAIDEIERVLQQDLGLRLVALSPRWITEAPSCP